MTEALQPGQLPPEALELIRAGRPTPRVEAPAVIAVDAGTETKPPAAPKAEKPVPPERRSEPVQPPASTPPLQPRSAKPRGTLAAKAAAQEAAEASEAGGLTSVTFRLPPNLASSLVRASADRKVKREKPYSQQEIAAAAIGGWLREHGYLS